MKTKLFLTLLLSFYFCLLSSQVPQGFNYQAIARDGSGNILPNTPLQAMMYVQSLSTGGTVFWKELHSSVTTNSFGLFTLVVGTGTRQTESTVATFNLIDWSITPKYLKTEIYYSGSWKDMGTSQLMSVPYAMTSGDLAGTVDKLSVKGTTSGLEEALFEVKNKDGQTVFAVYNEGVRIYVSDGAKAVKGGFAVGGFGTDKAESTKYLFVGKDSVRIYLDTNPLTKGVKSGFAVGGYDITKGTVQDYLDVNSDSVRIYIDSNPATKKVKGGFAVGGYDMTKAPQEEYLRVTRDSTRVYVNNSPAKAVKGGFAVGGFDITKGTQTITPFTSLTPQNYFIGHKSGIHNTSGIHNSFVGYETGINNTTGRKNVFLGYHAGMSNDTASYNVFIGNEAGRSNNYGRYNTFIGYQSGLTNTDGDNNVHLGYKSGYSSYGFSNVYLGTEAGYNATGYNNVYIGYKTGYAGYGQYNVFIGSNAGLNNAGGSLNTIIGDNAGYNNITGQNNVFLGTNAGTENKSGDNNTYLGFQAGLFNVSGTSNVFIGCYAGRGELGSNRLYISNSDNPLIYGEFDNSILRFNASVGINTVPTQMLDVNGNARFRSVASGTFSYNLNITSDGTLTTATSDISMKENIQQLSNALDEVNRLRGVTFTWKNDSTETRQIGMIAQEVEEIVPEIVFTNPVDGLKGINYSQATALLVEAIKEQQQQIESYKSQLQTLQDKVEKIETLLSKALGE